VYELTANAAADNVGMPAFRAALAFLLAAVDRDEEARVILDDLVADMPTIAIEPTWATMLGICADAAVLVGHRRAARTVVDLLGPFTNQWIWNGGMEWGPIALYTGIARTFLREHDAAEADFAEARAMAERSRSPYWAARTQVESAAMLADRREAGDHERARPLLDEALAAARAYEFAGIERRAGLLGERIGAG